jgi:hypothetical protein
MNDRDFSPDELQPARVKCVGCDRLLSESEPGPACADCEFTWRCWACQASMDNREIRAAMRQADGDTERMLCADCRAVGGSDE